nr:CRISPR-associated endonuclease Cas2 [Lawsonibacter faecis]
MQSGVLPQDRRGTRLYQIARQCVNFGQRVQASMSECLVDAAQCRSLQVKLCAVMVPGRESLRLYDLAKQCETKIESFGVKTSYEPEGLVMI